LTGRRRSFTAPVDGAGTDAASRPSDRRNRPAVDSVRAALAGGQTPERDPRTIVVEVRDRGFQWADAAIGALATLGLVVAGAGATLLIRRGRS
jgi:hypothetical protein